MHIIIEVIRINIASLETDLPG